MRLLSRIIRTLYTPCITPLKEFRRQFSMKLKRDIKGSGVKGSGIGCNLGVPITSWNIFWGSDNVD